MLIKPDAVLLARDDAENHLTNAQLASGKDYQSTLINLYLYLENFAEFMGSSVI